VQPRLLAIPAASNHHPLDFTGPFKSSI